MGAGNKLVKFINLSSRSLSLQNILGEFKDFANLLALSSTENREKKIQFMVLACSSTTHRRVIPSSFLFVIHNSHLIHYLAAVSR